MTRERIRQIEAKALRKLRYGEELSEQEDEKLGSTPVDPPVLPTEVCERVEDRLRE